MITNDTIIKAAKAAGLYVRVEGGCLYKGLREGFYPEGNDTDNAMIRRGAEIDVGFWWETEDDVASVEATAWIKKKNGDRDSIDVDIQVGNNKAQAEREAVILCAAAKWDAMNEGVE